RLSRPGSSPPSVFDRELELDLEVQHLRDRAPGLRCLGCLFDLATVCARRRHRGFEEALLEREVLEGDGSARGDSLRGDPAFSELRRHGHAETARVSRSDQLLRVGPGVALKASLEAVFLVLKGSTPDVERATSLLEPTVPNRVCSSLHRAYLLINSSR